MASRVQPVAVEIEEEPVEPQPIPAEMDPATSEVTRPSDLGFAQRREVHREIEVEPLQPRRDVDANGYVEIRMAETIEEFTFGNPNFHYKLEAGKRYRVPRHVASYLWQLGYVYQRG